MLSLLLLSLYCAITVSSKSLDIRPPYSFAKPTWWLDNLIFTRNINSTGGINARFSIYRSYYEKCPTFETEWAFLNPCGWKIGNAPLLCYAKDYETRNLPEDKWFTCQERPNAVDGERLLSEEEKQWIRWRTFNLEELQASKLNRSNAVESFQGPFRKVSFEFINGVRYVNQRNFYLQTVTTTKSLSRTHVNGSLLPADQVRVTQSRWTVESKWAECMFPNTMPDRLNKKPPNDQWACGVLDPGPSEYNSGIGGRYCASVIGLKLSCGILLTTSENLMSLTEFKGKYPL
jgi:hypothetical protein